MTLPSYVVRLLIFLCFIHQNLCGCVYDKIDYHDTMIIRDDKTSKYYLIKEGKYRYIQNDDDAIFLSYNKDNICVIKDLNILIEQGIVESSVLLPIKRDNPRAKCKRDEDFNRIDILSNNNRMILSHQAIGEYLNPSVFPNPWVKQFPNDLYILLHRNNESMYFLDGSFKISRVVNDYEFVGEFPVFKGFDFRMLSLNDELIISYSHVIHPYFNKTSLQRQGIKRIRMEKNKVFNSLPSVMLLSNPIEDDLNDKNWQKNWIQFIYKNDIYLISNISTMSVVKITDSILPNKMFDMSIQIIDKFQNGFNCYNNIEWNNNYGTMRGGSPALKIGNEYLAFFHSNNDRNHSCGSRNYFMGAFMFSAKPPFKLISVSKYPISFKNNKNIDNLVVTDQRVATVIFPMSYFLQDKNGNNIDNLTYKFKDYDDGTMVVLSTGLYDKYGMIWKINLFELKLSLTPIHC